MKIGTDKELLLRNMLNAPGGDPVYILDMLYDVLSSDEWHQWQDPPFEHFSEALTHMGQTWDKVLNLVKIQHPAELRGDIEKAKQMRWLRDKIKELHEKEVVEPNVHGTNQYSGLSIESPPSVTLKQQDIKGGTSRDYTIARLKGNGFPLLAEQVINGEMSAAEARRQAGYDVRKVAIRLDDPASAAATITKHMQRDQIDELISLLLEYIYKTT